MAHAAIEISMQAPDAGTGWFRIPELKIENHLSVDCDEGRWIVGNAYDRGVGGSLRRAVAAFVADSGWEVVSGEVTIIHESRGWRRETFTF